MQYRKRQEVVNVEFFDDDSVIVTPVHGEAFGMSRDAFAREYERVTAGFGCASCGGTFETLISATEYQRLKALENSDTVDLLRELEARFPGVATDYKPGTIETKYLEEIDLLFEELQTFQLALQLNQLTVDAAYLSRFLTEIRQAAGSNTAEVVPQWMYDVQVLLNEIHEYAQTSRNETSLINRRGDSRLSEVVNKVRRWWAEHPDTRVRNQGDAS